jgi:hypothetical protein
MPGADPFELAIFVVAAFLGSLIAGIAGFAFGLIASAIWLHGITPAQSAALIAAFAIVIQGATLWKLRHAMDVRLLLPFLIGAALGIPVGAEVLRWASPAQMRAFVGLALVLFSVYSLARPKLPIAKAGPLADAAVGVAGWISRWQHRPRWYARHRLGNTARMVEGRAARRVPARCCGSFPHDARVVRRKRDGHDGDRLAVPARAACGAVRDVARL